MPGTPEVLFEGGDYTLGRGGRTYDVSPNGQRFLMIKEGGGNASGHLVVVQNWLEELRRLVPTN